MSYHISSTDKNPSNPMLLGYGTDRLMSWCPSLNIYRVNRFNILTNDKPRKKYESPWITDSGGQTSVSNYSVTMTNYKFNLKSAGDFKRFDVIEELLMHNLVHVAETIFEYVGFPYTWACLRVNRLWYEFLAHHLFPRLAEKMMNQDTSLYDIFDPQELETLNPGQICWQVHQLKEVWQTQRPKLKRLSCDSFVLSLRVHHDRYLHCGLNNGTLQLWDLQQKLGTKLAEKEVHDKGVKSLDVSDEFIVTGSYDCTAKIWTKRTVTEWDLFHVINLHNDSVWDLKLRNHTLVTGGLDGFIGIFSLENRNFQVRYLFKACDDLVAAVDFDDNILISGFENSKIAMWTLNDAQLIRKLAGHTGGITGVKLNGNLFATSSYDGSVRLWTLEGENLAVFDEPTHLLRCIGFTGNTIISGDFGGHVHIWELEFVRPTMVHIKKYHTSQIHKSHVVCMNVSARRIVTGSRDKSVLVQDFWASVTKK